MSELSLPKVFDQISGLAPFIEKIGQAVKLSTLVLATLRLAHALALIVLESELNRRAREPVEWPNCPSCESKRRAKGSIIARY
jgi:hypothetical protein